MREPSLSHLFRWPRTPIAERPGGRLLDVGCGWGSMAIHAATHHDVSVVGITISEDQAALAKTEAGGQTQKDG